METPDSPAAIVEQLARVALFRGLQPKEIMELVRAAGRRRVQSGNYFFYQDDSATTYYVLLEGRVRVAQVTPDGHQVILHLVNPGEGFGLLAALSRSRFPASAEALEDCLALTWDGTTMNRLFERFGRLALNALEMLAGRVHELQDRYRELATERVERRVARALLRLVRQSGRRVPEGVLVDFPLSRQDLAEMTGTTLYTVSRILSSWETDGLIESGRERVVIRRPHALVSIAEDLPQPDTTEH